MAPSSSSAWSSRLSEYWQRLAVSRFVVPTIDDARVGIFTRLISSSSPQDLARDPGDVLTRVVGDSARLRVGLRGLLTHLLQHGLFIVGVFVVLTVLDLRLGMVYLLGLLVALTIAGRGAVRTAAMARRARRRESKHAGPKPRCRKGTRSGAGASRTLTATVPLRPSPRSRG